MVKLCSYHSDMRNDYFTTSTCGAPPGPDYTGPVHEGQVFDPAAPAPPGTVPLYLWYSAERGDNFTTSDPAWAPGTVHAFGYGYARIEGYVFSDSAPGRCPLKSYYIESFFGLDIQDNYLTSRPSSDVPLGYGEYRTEGYMPVACP
jgi:hypothetical protein